MKNIKLIDFIPDEHVDASALSKVLGGAEIMLLDGCYSGICSQRVNTSYCSGGAVCTRGIAG